MYLDPDKKDKWGVPLIVFDAAFSDNDRAIRKDIIASAVEMLETAGFKNVTPYDRPTHLGLGIHDMGTARMGRDPKTVSYTHLDVYKRQGYPLSRFLT